MNTTETIKDIVYNQGLNILLQRMGAVLDNNTLQKLCNPVIVSADITDMGAVIAKIKEKWTVFNIKDVKVNLKHQTIYFKIWGGPYWINRKHSSYIVLDGAWSEVETEEYNYQKTIEEVYAEQNCLPLSLFIEHGIEFKTI